VGGLLLGATAVLVGMPAPVLEQAPHDCRRPDYESFHPFQNVLDEPGGSG
jgi:hypothetical protein